MSTTTRIRVSLHAALRYAQRVLCLDIDEASFRRAPALRGRCERGVGRILERATRRRNGDQEVWIAGRRAVVVIDGRAATVLVARANKGFSKFFLRRHGGLGIGAEPTAA